MKELMNMKENKVKRKEAMDEVRIKPVNQFIRR